MFFKDKLSLGQRFELESDLSPIDVRTLTYVLKHIYTYTNKKISTLGIKSTLRVSKTEIFTGLTNL